MTFKDIFDIATRISGVLALLIISIPKLTEQVLSKYLSIALEKQKKVLQIEVENHKSELSKSLETHKARLQQAQIEEQRKYAEEVRHMNEVSQHLIGTLNDLLTDIRETLQRLSGSQELTYQEMKSFLDRTNSRNVRSTICLQYIQTISEECERPGAMVDNDFTEDIRTRMMKFARETEAEITKIKGGACETTY